MKPSDLLPILLKHCVKSVAPLPFPVHSYGILTFPFLIKHFFISTTSYDDISVQKPIWKKSRLRLPNGPCTLTAIFSMFASWDHQCPPGQPCPLLHLIFIGSIHCWLTSRVIFCVQHTFAERITMIHLPWAESLSLWYFFFYCCEDKNLQTKIDYTVSKAAEMSGTHNQIHSYYNDIK